jgi:eukaryotic-like serine/threonine-protein kinase
VEKISDGSPPRRCATFTLGMMRLDPRGRVGEVLDATYCIEEYLGGGAMGSVFRVRDLKAGGQVAVKLLHDRLRSDPKIRRRFAREAELAAQLRHPNVIGVRDVAGDGAYLVMDYAPGRTLAQLIAASAPFSYERAITIIRQLLDGLDHAHGLGLIHRDLKPDNVIVEHTGDHEVARIVDFGIAIVREHAASRDEGRFTTDGLVLGTPQYMAPELATGRTFDHRIDLFALGVICFQMLTGRTPFEGSGVDVALANVSTNTPPMGVRVPNLHVDPLLEAFTRKLLAKRVDDRFANAAAARAVLDLIESDPKTAARELMVSSPRIAVGTRSPAVVIPTPLGPSVTPEEMAALATSKVAALATAETQALETLETPLPRRYRSLAIAMSGIAATVLAAIALISC